MHCWVYRMRESGQRIAGADPRLRRGVEGWLEFSRSIMDVQQPSWEAHLRDGRGGKDLVLPLYRARLLRVDGVLHLAGRESLGRQTQKAKSRPAPQSWLVALDPLDALRLIDKVYVGSATGFSAEDDDEPEPEWPMG